jgi:hypothetical protein
LETAALVIASRLEHCARIGQQETQIKAALAELSTESADQEVSTKKLDGARSLLLRWRQKARGKLTFAVRRAVVEALVESVIIAPRETGMPDVQAIYCFEDEAQQRFAGRLPGGYAVQRVTSKS